MPIFDQEELNFFTFARKFTIYRGQSQQQKISWGWGCQSLMNAAACYVIKNRNCVASLWILAVL